MNFNNLNDIKEGWLPETKNLPEKEERKKEQHSKNIPIFRNFHVIKGRKSDTENKDTAEKDKADEKPENFIKRKKGRPRKVEIFKEEIIPKKK